MDFTRRDVVTAAPKLLAGGVLDILLNKATAFAQSLESKSNVIYPQGLQTEHDHNLYDTKCCNRDDCRPVLTYTIPKLNEAGTHYYIEIDEYVILHAGAKATKQTSKYSVPKENMLPSKNLDSHICVTANRAYKIGDEPMPALCFYWAANA